MSAETHTDTEARRLLWWHTLSREEQIQTIRGLSADGMSDYDLASATKLSVEMIRQILGQGRRCEACEQ